MPTELGAKLATAPALAEALNVNKRFVQRAPFSRRRFVVQALQNVSLTLHHNSVTALVGESGSGKSTLAACLAGLEHPDSGEIWFEGADISRSSAAEIARLRSRVQMVFQDSSGALNPRFTAAQIVREPLEIQRCESGNELSLHALELLQEVGLPPECAERSPLQLSGGQRQRLALARAIALQPSLLILDETLSGLDLITRNEILVLLRELLSKFELTYLLISHDLSLVPQIADYVAVMREGRILEQGRVPKVITQPESQYTRELLSFAAGMESAWRAAATGAQA